MAGGFEHYANHLIKQNLAKLKGGKRKDMPDRYKNDQRMSPENRTDYDELLHYNRSRRTYIRPLLITTGIILAIILAVIFLL